MIVLAMVDTYVVAHSSVGNAIRLHGRLIDVMLIAYYSPSQAGDLWAPILVPTPSDTYPLLNEVNNTR